MSVSAHGHQVATLFLDPFDDLVGGIAVRQFGLNGNVQRLEFSLNLFQVAGVFGDLRTDCVRAIGSRRPAIGYVQQQKISVTRSSKNLIEEYENYYWATNAQGETTGKPEGGKDHALDALRYAFDGQRPKPMEEYIEHYQHVTNFAI